MSAFGNNDFNPDASQRYFDPKDATEQFPTNPQPAEQNVIEGGSHRDANIPDSHHLNEDFQGQDASQFAIRPPSALSLYPQSALFGSSGPSNMNIFPYQTATTDQPRSGSSVCPVFTGSDTMEGQQQRPQPNPCELDTRFNAVSSGFDPHTFTTHPEPMATYSFGAAPHFSAAGDMPLDFANVSAMQTQPMSHVLTDPPHAPQFSMQGSNDEIGLTAQVDSQTVESRTYLRRPIPSQQRLLNQDLEPPNHELQIPNKPTYQPSGPIFSDNLQPVPQNHSHISAEPTLAPTQRPQTSAGEVASQFLNVYSSSGFDMFGILARIATRPNPEIMIGAVDMSCAFILCDITAHDDPIVYVSEAFEKLTGYTKHEIVGRNCRFLQAPDGKVEPSTRRKYVDDHTIHQLKTKIQSRSEVQASVINYRKGGQPFMNLLTMIPVAWDTEDYKFYVGFQVDLVEAPQAVTKRNPDGSYSINYQRNHLPRFVLPGREPRRVPQDRTKSVSQDEVSMVLRSIGIGVLDVSNRLWERVLLDNIDDVVHILSLKGLFLYLSPSSSKVLEYDASDLVGTSLSSVCHPSDIVPVIRELKQSMSGSAVSIIYRVRRKRSGYMWFESHGALHVEPKKGRKCLILVGRERPIYALNRLAIIERDGIGEHDLWTKVSISGIFLFVSSNAMELLDYHPDQMIGTSLQESMRSESRGELGKALEIARTGHQATFKHELRHKRGHVLPAETTLFPGDANPGSRPSFLIAQTCLQKSSRSAYATQRSSIVASSTDNTLSSGLASPYIVSSATFGSIQSHREGSGIPQSFQRCDTTTETSSYGPPPGNQDNALLSEDNIFEELGPTRSSSWQFELRQLERKNRSLEEELQGLLSRRKKRKRKKGTGL